MFSQCVIYIYIYISPSFPPSLWFSLPSISGAVVRLASQANEEVTILGIDNYGYLRVETNRSKEVLSLQPDGNTFDIMKGLIATKLDCN